MSHFADDETIALLEKLRAENEALHAKLAQFTKWNSELTAKCNWYNCDGARLERENEALKQQVEQGKRDAELESLRKDAERYRFIRDVPYSGDVRVVMEHQQNTYMDETIDAAIAAAPKQEK